MANTPKKLYAGTPGTTSAILYTAPASTKTIVKNIVISNTTASNATITLTFGGQAMMNAYSIAGNDTVVIPLSLVLESTETITGLQGTSNSLRIHISGVEVS